MTSAPRSCSGPWATSTSSPPSPTTPGCSKRWSQFGGTLLYRGELPARERELLILRTAFELHADYEWGQHVRIGMQAGVTADEIAAIATPTAADPAWSADDAALVRAADELHADAHISDDTWATLAERWTTRSSSSCAWSSASTTSSPSR